MPVAPEQLITQFSLAQVAEMIIAWEDAQHETTSDELAVDSSDAPTVRPASKE
jgi:hypothetical protein